MAFLDRQSARLLFLSVFLLCTPRLLHADARFDLIGPKIDVNVTRNGVTRCRTCRVGTGFGCIPIFRPASRCITF
jgi:hypothetical protein